jgi:hypothetical protein
MRVQVKGQQALGVLLAAVVWLAAATAGADQITIGANGSAFCAPFGCNTGAGTRFQQVYDDQSFLDASPTNPILITQIDFFNVDPGSPNNNLTTGDYEIRLSTTSVAVDALDTIFDNNVGGDEQIFKTFSLANSQSPDVLSFVADTAYLYDPTAGNLLLDVFANGPSMTFPFATFEALDGAGGLFSIMHDFGGTESDDFGLVTRIHFTIIPEPSTGLLFGMGILAIGLRRR